MIDVDCGPLKGIKDGESVIIDGRTTFRASVKYTCAENYTLVGASKWSGVAPQCREIRCPMPERPDGVVLSISSSDRLLRAVTLLRTPVIYPVYNDQDISVGSVVLMAGGLVSFHCASVKFYIHFRNQNACFF